MKQVLAGVGLVILLTTRVLGAEVLPKDAVLMREQSIPCASGVNVFKRGYQLSSGQFVVAYGHGSGDAQVFLFFATNEPEQNDLLRVVVTVAGKPTQEFKTIEEAQVAGAISRHACDLPVTQGM